MTFVCTWIIFYYLKKSKNSEILHVLNLKGHSFLGTKVFLQHILTSNFPYHLKVMLCASHLWGAAALQRSMVMPAHRDRGRHGYLFEYRHVSILYP